jgi:hypothetical protein
MAWRHMGEWRYTPTILNLGTRWKRVVNFTHVPFTHGETAPGTEGCIDPRADLDSMERTISCPYQESNRGRKAQSLVTTPTTLSQG